MVRVGPPHFKRLVKNIRDSVYNCETAFHDIVDNVRSKYVNIKVSFEEDIPIEYRISDDYKFGFENIEKDDELNPFNMGHVCREQNEDKFTSEYGMGFKNASIYMADLTIVITRIIIEDGSFKYFKIVIDIEKMCNETNAIDSYQPFIQEIDFDYYNRYHIVPSGFEIGSSIYLLKLRTSTDTIQGDVDEQISSLKTSLSKTYYYSIKNNNKIITINDVIIETDVDIFEAPECVVRMFTTTIKVNMANGLITGIYYKQTRNNNNTYNFLNLTTNRVNKGNQRDYEAVVDNYKLLKLKSTSTFNTEYKNIQHCNTLQICRDGRNHGILDFLELHRKDGYMNHVANILHYKSKELNTFIGMTSTKRVVERKNPLTKVLKHILKQFESTVESKGLHLKAFPEESEDESEAQSEAQSENESENVSEVNQPITTSNVLNISRTVVSGTTRLTSQSPKNILIYAKNKFNRYPNSNFDQIIENASDTSEQGLATYISNFDKFEEYLIEQGLEFY